jgi:hypothetical protein
MVSIPLLLLLNLSLLLGASSAHEKPKRIEQTNTFRAGRSNDQGRRSLAANVTGIPAAPRSHMTPAGHGMGVKSSGSSPHGPAGSGTKTGTKKKAPSGTKSANLRAGTSGGGGSHNTKSGFILEVSLFTDGYPEETSHFLYDVDYGTYLFWYDGFDAYSFYSELWELDPNGCYQYYILDTYGDGMESGYGAVVMVDGWEYYNSGAYGYGEYVPMGRSDCW